MASTDPSSAETVFFAALERAGPAERDAYLNEACAGDAELRRQVDWLLNAHARSGQFLERPVAEAECVSDVIGAEGDDDSDVDRDEVDLSFLAQSSEPDSLGRLGHYEILGVVGCGGQIGEVNTADDRAGRGVEHLDGAVGEHDRERRGAGREPCDLPRKTNLPRRRGPVGGGVDGERAVLAEQDGSEPASVNRQARDGTVGIHAGGEHSHGRAVSRG